MIFKNSNLLKISLIASLLTSCGESPKDEKKSPTPFGPETPIEIRKGDNLTSLEQQGYYQIEDIECQKFNGALNFQSLYVNLWNGQYYENKELANDTKISSEPYLQSPAVKEVIRNFSTIDECTYDKETFKDTCEEKPVVTSVGEKIKICKDGYSYERTSVEATAITSLRFIDQAAKFYHSLPGSNIKLPKIELSIFPKLGSLFRESPFEDFDEVTIYDSDNLYFIPYPSHKNQKYTPTITVFPSSKLTLEPEGDSFNAHLWESEFILSHEYGHFVLFEHSKLNDIIALSSAQVQKGLKEFTHSKMRTQKYLLQQLGLLKSEDTSNKKREVTFIEHWGAINEAYADLFAYYSNHMPIGALNGYQCFEQSREVSAAEFYNTNKKVFDLQAYDTFTSDKQETLFVDCKTTNDLQEIHSFGAVLAFGINQLFTNSEFAADQNPEKLGELTLKWADNLGKLILSDIANPNLDNVTVLTMLQEAVKVASMEKDGKNILTQGQCNVLLDHMEHLWNSVKDKYECESSAHL